MASDKPKICMVGSSMVDLVARVPKLPEPGETLVGTAFSIGFGGKGSNQAVMAARLGADVAAVVKLGTDVFGENTKQNYIEQGIDTTHVLFDEERFSGVAPINVEESTGQNSIIVVPGANYGLSPADVRNAADKIQAADVVICQLEILTETTMEAFKVAKEADKNVLTLLNPAPAAALPDELLQLTDIIAPNESEATTLTRLPVTTNDEATAAAKALQARGVTTVIITLGERGAMFIEGDGAPQFVQAERVKAKDSTGAGDAFVGSFAYFIGKGLPMRDAVQRACAIATKSVLKDGTQTSFPYRDDVLDIING